jgi:hypothetical protein
MHGSAGRPIQGVAWDKAHRYGKLAAKVHYFLYPRAARAAEYENMVRQPARAKRLADRVDSR